MPEVVEPDGRESGVLEERCEGPLPQVGRVHECPPLRGEEEPLVLVEIAEAFQLLQLAGEVSFEGFHSRLRKAHRPTAAFRLRFAEKQPSLAAGQRAPHPQ